MANAMRLYFQCTHIVAEGAGAAALQLRADGRLSGVTIGLPLCGDNVDAALFAQILGAATVDQAAPRPGRERGGRPPYPTYQLLDRRSFLQFLDLTERSSIPDAKTIRLFRNRLAQA